jgi:uncharacterized protein YjbJ (UPF0337 family)
MNSIAKTMIVMFACVATVEAVDNSLTCDSEGNCMLSDELAATKDNWSGSVKTKWGTISGSSKLADEAAAKDNWSGSVKTKWGTISGSSKLADTKDNWSGSVKTKWGTISGSSKLADEAAAKDNWKLSGGFGGWGASVGVQSRLATKGNKDVSLGFKGPGGANVGLEFCAPSTYGRGAGKTK